MVPGHARAPAPVSGSSPPVVPPGTSAERRRLASPIVVAGLLDRPPRPLRAASPMASPFPSRPSWVTWTVVPYQRHPVAHRRFTTRRRRSQRHGHGSFRHVDRVERSQRADRQRERYHRRDVGRQRDPRLLDGCADRWNVLDSSETGEASGGGEDVCLYGFRSVRESILTDRLRSFACLTDSSMASR